jgi:hypothetical protein
MITNQRQYLVAQGQAERFRQALAAPDAKGLHPKAVRAMNAGLRSQLDDIETELAEYDALSQGRVTEFEAESIVGIGLYDRWNSRRGCPWQSSKSSATRQRFTAAWRPSGCSKWPMRCGCGCARCSRSSCERRSRTASM